MTAKRYGVSLWGDKNDETVVTVAQLYKYICTVWARVLQRNRAKKIYLSTHPSIHLSIHALVTGIHAWSGICKLENKELTAMSPSLSPKTWEPRKPKSKGFAMVKMQKLMFSWNSLAFPMIKQMMILSTQAKRANLSFLCLFVLFTPSVNWMMSAGISEGHLLYPIYLFKC